VNYLILLLVPNTNSTSNTGINESRLDMNSNHRLSEYQRLLYMES